MICPKCGFNHESQNGYCPNCGAPAQAQNGYNPQMNNFNQGGYNQNPYGYNQNPYGSNGFKAPIKSKDIVLAIILSIVTCGIYGIIWFINLTDDLNVASGDVNGTTGGMAFLLTLVTCGIYGFYWAYKCGEKVSIIKQRQGMPADTTASILYLLLEFFGLGIVVYALAQSELNKVASM